jgi:4-methylaminobutanoate oxidase (formaldehyde-forming)
MAEIPNHASAVVIGGGAVGCSVAYHLAKLGWTDVVLLERRQLSCGTTWHAAGLITQLRNTKSLTEIARYAPELFPVLEEETGVSTGFRQTGSLSLALTDARMEELARTASMARSFNVEVEEISLADAERLYPFINLSDAVGAIHIPKDGQADPTNITQAFAKGARLHGAKVLENIKVTSVLQAGGRVTGVAYEKDGEPGEIRTERVVNCAGMWGRDLAEASGVSVPLHACEHFYIVTEPIPDLPRSLPVLRVPDEQAYYKEDAGKILLGAFELEAKPWGQDGIPEDFCFDQLPDDFDHFAPVLEMAVNRMPALETAGIHTFFNGPESFTPDDRFHLGEAPELAGYFVAAGFNSIGVQTAAGAGKALAEWIEAGSPQQDLWDVDIRRMQPFQNNRTYLCNRVSETLGLLYADHFPYRQYATARDIRHSPLHERLAGLGACFGETAGWERPNWFVPAGDLEAGVKPEYEYGWGRQNWFNYAAGEHKAVRESVGLFDLTSFSKYRVEGRDAEAVLQRICANNIAVEPGRIVYTQWLNERGGVEADLTVTRLSETVFLVVSGAACAVRDMAWLRRHIPADAHCIATDLTSAESCISIMGPNARALLQQVTRADLSNEAFPFATARQIEIGMTTARAHRISYVGELGWEIYVPSEMTRHVFDAIVENGGDHGLRLCGMHVLDSCRLEKGFRHFGHDIADDDHVLEAGLGFAVKPDKPAGKYGSFIGRDAVLEKKQAGLGRRMLQFLLDDPEPLIYHTEPIWRDGEIAGYLTSGNYGHHLGAAVGLGYVTCEPDENAENLLQSTYEIEIAGTRVAARPSLKPLYDPTSERARK